MRTAIAVAAALSVSSCVSRPISEADVGPPPKNYKALAATYLRPKFFDPYSIRDAEITEPFVGRMDGNPGWIVCSRQNSKNRFGGYTGIQESAVLFKGGVPVDHSIDAPVCEKHPHTSWPELMSAAKI